MLTFGAIAIFRVHVLLAGNLGYFLRGERYEGLAKLDWRGGPQAERAGGRCLGAGDHPCPRPGRPAAHAISGRAHHAVRHSDLAFEEPPLGNPLDSTSPSKPNICAPA